MEEPRVVRRWLYWASSVAAAWPIVLTAWLHLMLLAARVQLGRWPHRMGLDDPKSMPVVGEMHLVAVMGLLAAPFLVLGGVAGLVFIFWHDTIRGLGLIALVVLLWFGLWALGDPARVSVWFFD